MKKFVVLGLGVGMAFAMTSCKSSESAYKKAYEKARQQQTVAVEQEPQAPVEVTPTTPVTTTPVTPSTDVNSVPVRTENVTLVSGAGLKAYSVVCGSFSLKANAEGLQRRLTNAGYTAQIAYNDGNKMYRVVASTFDDKASAVQSRTVLRNTYPDAWLLYKK